MDSTKWRKVQDMFLWPGDMICRLFQVKNMDERFFLRFYVNIFLYTKVVVGIAVLLALWDLNIL